MKIQRSILSAVMVAAVAMSSLACGSDEEAAPPPPSPAAGKKKAAAKGKKGGKGGRLQAYAKVDDELRHRFAERDFTPDATGETHRDPFRSYLVAQALLEDEGSTGEITEICPPERTIANKYSLRALNLIGIVLRGTSSYALFRDPTRYGHIVRRGDCLGKEKAVVNEIGAGYVSLEISPEAPQGTAAPPAQKRTIALYPEEMSIENAIPDEPVNETIETLPVEPLPSQ